MDSIQTCNYLSKEVKGEAWQTDRQTLELDVLIPVLYVSQYLNVTCQFMSAS